MSSEREGAQGAPSPKIKQRTGLSVVWLVPLIAALIGGWLVVKTLTDQGPQITISFETAEGIEPGKTLIKYKNVQIGLVESLQFSDDFSQVTLTANLSKEAASFLKRDTRFWVVRPRLDMRGVSGLGTLVSGAYIEIEPGRGADRRHFIGLENPPVVREGDEGKKVVLVTEKLGSIGQGSPVYYQGLEAGEVLGYELANDKRSVFIHAFIKAPFDKLIHGNTRFWNVSGLDISADASGFRVRTESLTSLLYGGIAFDTPDGGEVMEEGLDGLVFTLFGGFDKIEEYAYTKKVRFVLFFDRSVRGLAIGAPVEFKGIKVGSVIDVRLEFDTNDATFHIPVTIEIEPERVIERGGEASTPIQMLQTLVERGLRARLQTGSLLTGQLFVELDMFPGSPLKLSGEGGKVAELPTLPGEFDEIAASVKGILVKFEQLDLESIASELEQTLAGANKLINSDEVGGVVSDAKTALEILRGLLQKIDKHAEPMVGNLDQTIVAARDAMKKLEVTIEHVDGVVKPGSPTLYRVDQMAEELAEMARSIRILVDLLERDPQSVLFGKGRTE
ncbi:intermembrane transport protein PqiB [Candidatus Reidiella endopervernicosa]|uniref:PqiB family protein n=1 Tax=Candidatus Reidiella endopervernicosa TaxID=2738883 RepID=UPI001EEFA000|nr:MlaD family protein [Candidatus Reidiella endopervernicosa]